MQVYICRTIGRVIFPTKFRVMLVTMTKERLEYDKRNLTKMLIKG